MFLIVLLEAASVARTCDDEILLPEQVNREEDRWPVAARHLDSSDQVLFLYWMAPMRR